MFIKDFFPYKFVSRLNIMIFFVNELFKEFIRFFYKISYSYYYIVVVK